MSEKTKIQWCDSTINPIMGCGGCELFPAPDEVMKAIDQAVEEAAGSEFKSRAVLKRLVDECFDRIDAPEQGHKKVVNTTNIWHLRKKFYAKVEASHGRAAKKAAQHALEQSVTCYAGKDHLKKGASILKPDYSPKLGYAPIFEKLTSYTGRVGEMADEKDLLGRFDPDSPWKERLPRMIFVSDMGDAFSRKSDFDFLVREVMEPVLSEAGQRHLWLWLTKRPKLMADFAGTIGGFPEHVCAMTTVTGPDTLYRIDELREVSAKTRGLSLEPILERIPPSKLKLEGIDWVIVGGESGAMKHVREFPLEWVEELREHCRKHSVAFFVKQLGRKPTRDGKVIKLKDSHGGDWNEWEEYGEADLKTREFPKAFHDYRKDEMKISNELRPSLKKGKPKKHGLTKEETADFRRLDKKVRKGVKAYVEAGMSMAEIHDRKLWKAGGHTCWEDYCKAVAGMSRNHAHRLIQAARISTMLADTLPIGNTGTPVLPQSETQVRHLTKLKDQEKQVEAWKKASEKAGGTPTEREVKEAVVEILEPEKPVKPTEDRTSRCQRLIGRLQNAVERRSWKQIEEVLGELEHEFV